MFNLNSITAVSISFLYKAKEEIIEVVKQNRVIVIGLKRSKEKI